MKNFSIEPFSSVREIKRTPQPNVGKVMVILWENSPKKVKLYEFYIYLLQMKMLPSALHSWAKSLANTSPLNGCCKLNVIFRKFVSHVLFNETILL